MRMTPIVPVLSFLLLVSAAQGQTPQRSFLFKDVRVELAAARARGDSTVLLVIASMPKANAKVAAAIAGMGGTVQFRSDDVDYLRARVPLDRVDALAGDANVHSISISFRPQQQGGGGNENTIIATDTSRRREWPPMLLSDYPIRNRYDPIGDLRADNFLKQNPTYDGRGVTLAIIDMSLDPLLPELQTAYTLDGRPVPKIVGYENALDAVEEDDGRWLRMTDQVTAVNGELKHKDRSYRAPRDGTFRIDILDEVVLDSLSRNGMRRDLNRDGNPKDGSRLFAVLWDEQTNDVWVDTNQDGDFRNEKALTDFSVRPEFGVFGTDDPRTAVRESVGFAVQIDAAKKQVALNIGAASHATLVVGAAVASRGERGRFNGVAPGAQLVNVAEGCAAYGQTEAVIKAVQNPKVDIVWLEHCNNITRPYTLRDGRLVTTVIYDRLIEKYRKPIMIPTHNYPVLGGTDDFVLARGAIGVGGHESKENFFLNHGVQVKHDDNLLITGGYGPMGNGAFGADIISPSNYISTARGWEETRPIAGLYRLPPGYTIAGGTSTATPTAAGAVALLISAARQNDIKFDAYRIRHAIISSARWVPHLPAYKQGSGVVNVAAAWEILKALNSAPLPPEITAVAPVIHSYSHLLPVPNQGVGLYERSGWTAGSRGERTITFTRQSGPREPMTFQVAWVGNDSATFSAPATITLPLNRPTVLPVTIEPKTAGAHTAMLTLTHANVPGVAHRLLSTIVAAEPLNADNKYTHKLETEVPRPEMRSFFYDVPAGVGALRVDIEQPQRDVAVAIVKPDTRTASATRVAPAGGGGGGGGGNSRQSRVTYVVTDPMPGVWEIRLSDLADTQEFDRLQAESNEPVPPTPATMTVAAIRAEISLAAAPAPTSSGTSAQDVTIENMLATFTGSLAGLPMGAARRERVDIAHKQQREFTIDVPAGSTMLMAKAMNATADLDLYVLDCTRANAPCRSPQTDSDPVGDEIVTVNNPAAGTWKVIVDAPFAGASFDYLDAVFSPAFGTVAVADVAKERKAGDSWRAPVMTWLTSTLPAGREALPAALLQGQLGDGTVFPLMILDLARGRMAATPSQRERAP
jgi:subtilisin family serine protease